MQYHAAYQNLPLDLASIGDLCLMQPFPGGWKGKLFLRQHSLQADLSVTSVLCSKEEPSVSPSASLLADVSSYSWYASGSWHLTTVFLWVLRLHYCHP